MSICLINPFGPKYRFDDSNDQLPPLGLLTIAAYLEANGHEVSVLDGELSKESAEELACRIPKDTSLIGIGGTTFQCTQAYRLADVIKKTLPDATIIYGGIHASCLREKVFDNTDALDGVVIGPGEIPMTALALGAKLADVPGLIWPGANGDIVVNELANPLPIDDVPLPARHLVPIFHYIGVGKTSYRQTSIMVTRGCPFRCTFCANAVWGKTWSRRSPGKIVAELKTIKQMGFREVFFQDDTINVSPSWAEELFDAIIEADLGLEYKICFRANENLLPEKLVAKAKKAGVWEVFFGVESANDSIRERCNKGIDQDDVRRAISLTKKHGIKASCAFIIGLPGESRATVRESIDFAKELAPHEVGFSIATPFPGTLLREDVIANGWLEEESYEKLNLTQSICRTEHLTCDEITQLRNDAHQEVSNHLQTHYPHNNDLSATLETLLAMKQRGDSLGTALVNMRLGRLYLDKGMGMQAKRCLARVIGCEELSVYIQAQAMGLFGLVLARDGDHEEALHWLRQAHTIGEHSIKGWVQERYREFDYIGIFPEPAFDEQSLRSEKDLYGSYGRWQREYAHYFDRAFDLAGKRILDIGSALGAHVKAFFEEIHADVWGIDALPCAKELSPFGKVIKDRLLTIDMRDADRDTKLGEKKFDFFHASQSLHYIDSDSDITACLQSFAAMAKPGAILYASGCFGSEAGDNWQNHKKRVSRKRILELAKIAGWDDAESVYGFLLDVGSGLGKTSFSSEYDWQRVILRRSESRNQFQKHREILSIRQKVTEMATRVLDTKNQACRAYLELLVSNSEFDITLRMAVASILDCPDMVYKAHQDNQVDYAVFGQWQQNYAAMLDRFFNLKGKRVLDFGCASGSHIKAFTQAGADCWGLEINRQYVDHAIDDIASRVIHFSPDKLSDVQLRFDKASFDIIMVSEVWEHVPPDQKQAYIKLFRRLLKSGGCVFVSCPTGDQAAEDVFGQGVFADPTHLYLQDRRVIASDFAQMDFRDDSNRLIQHIRKFRADDGFSFWVEYASLTDYFLFVK